MRYDSSLTFSLKYYIRSHVAKKLTAQEKTWNLKDSAEDFRKFLCTAEYVHTLDFVIRRYIQSRHPELLPRNADLIDLTQDTNLPWDEATLQYLADELAVLSVQQGARIEKKEWQNYLSGTKSIRDRKKAFMIAFVLHMTVEDTLDILLACHLEPYSPRLPMDLICMFCQKKPGRYTWGQAEEMYETFLSRRTKNAERSVQPTAGMTQKLTTGLDNIFGKDLDDDDAREALLQYMLENQGEFPAFVKRVQRADKSRPSGHSYKEMEYFLPGYSMTRTKQFQRLTQYLAVLYPSYTVAKRKKSIKTDDSYQEEIRVDVPLDENGIPHLPYLVRAMLSSSNLLAKEFNWDGSTFDSGDDEYDDASFSLEQYMRRYWTNYLQHIMAIDRLLSRDEAGSNEDHQYQNYEYFKRNDILLFLYFLIDGYRKICIGEDSEEKLDSLLQLRDSDEEFDGAIDEILDKVEFFSTQFQEDDYKEKVDMLRVCFDNILVQMDYMKLYLPSLFDRLYFSMLLSNDPSTLLRLVLCQGER